MNFTITRAIRWWARECPNEVAISVEDQPVTFAELFAWAGRVGDSLLKQDVKPGDRVSAVAMNCLDYAVLAIALVRIGAIGAPLSFRSTASEIKDWLAELTPTLVFTDEDRRAVTAEALGDAAEKKMRPLSAISELRHGADVSLDIEVEEDAPAFIIGTSGSTARPKGVIYTHRMVVTYASEFVLMEPRCGRGSRILSVGPFSSSSGYLLLMQFMTLGATMYIESQFHPERALKLLTAHRITTFMGAPIFFERIAALDAFAAADISSLYWTQVGGARVSPTLLKAWHDKGVILRHAYGSTEAGGAWGARNDVAVAEPGKCGSGGLFSEYAILLEDGSEFGTIARCGGPGEILIRSACLTTGYWNNRDATAEAIRDGWLHTGDIGVLDENGNMTFVDRLKDIIISGGLNISAAEVERIISEVPGVTEVAVIAANDKDFGETPLAIAYGDERVSIPAIIEHCKQHLADYKVPRYIAIEREPLPRLISGKISKPLLRQKFKGAENSLPKVR